MAQSRDSQNRKGQTKTKLYWIFLQQDTPLYVYEL